MEVRQFIQQDADVNYLDKEANNTLLVATINNHIEVLRILQQNNVDFNIINKQGNNALHYACQQENKELILFMIMNGVDPNVKNFQDQKPGENKIEIKMFINSLIAEHKAFKALNQQQKRRLTEIFEDIDYDNQKSIDIEKSKKFNQFIDPKVNDSLATKDARDFITSCALCNKTSVNLEEWIFAFSKTFVVDENAFNKFLEDYDSAVEQRGKFSKQDHND